MRSPTLWRGAAASILVLVVGWPSAARAATAAGSDTGAVLALSEQITSNSRKIAALDEQLASVNGRVEVLTAGMTQVQAELDRARTELTKLKAALRTRATQLYEEGHRPALALGGIGHVRELSAGSHYAAAAARTDTVHVGSLGRMTDEIEARREVLDRQRREVATERDRLADLKSALEDSSARLAKLLEASGGITVMGAPEVTAAQVAGWFDSTGIHTRLSGTTTMADLVNLYYDEGAAENVRPDLAFAQAIIETGWFRSAVDNNYAGIGACDGCNGEPSFPTPRDGVRGQIQLLRVFADPTANAAGLAHAPSPVIFGPDPAAAAARFDTYFAKGRIPTWNAMGNGNWATDPTYARKVLSVYARMVAFVKRG
jgi:hypothetical protein